MVDCVCSAIQFTNFTLIFSLRRQCIGSVDISLLFYRTYILSFDPQVGRLLIRYSSILSNLRTVITSSAEFSIIQHIFHTNKWDGGGCR